jgi:hypothetical protein
MGEQGERFAPRHPLDVVDLPGVNRGLRCGMDESHAEVAHRLRPRADHVARGAGIADDLGVVAALLLDLAQCRGAQVLVTVGLPLGQVGATSAILPAVPPSPMRIPPAARIVSASWWRLVMARGSSGRRVSFPEARAEV